MLGAAVRGGAAHNLGGSQLGGGGAGAGQATN